MTKEEILHLGQLARIRINEQEVEGLQKDISAILEYVGTINDVVDEGKLEKVPGPVYNVFREDTVTNEPGSYTKELLDEMPARHGDYLEVKKIIDQNK